jgi:hypothetical protein
VLRGFVRTQAAEGVLTAKEARRALEMGASAAQVERWSEGQGVSEKAQTVLGVHSIAARVGGAPSEPFSKAGRDYGSVQDFVRYQAAEGILTASEVTQALGRGATADQIEQWASGQTISSEAQAVLKVARNHLSPLALPASGDNAARPGPEPAPVQAPPTRVSEPRPIVPRLPSMPPPPTLTSPPSTSLPPPVPPPATALPPPPSTSDDSESPFPAGTGGFERLLSPAERAGPTDADE